MLRDIYQAGERVRPEHYALDEGNFWLDPNGKLLFVSVEGHSNVAYDVIGVATYTLEERGWLHISSGYIFGGNGVEITSAQYDVLAALAANTDNSPSHVREEWSYTWNRIMSGEFGS